MYKAHINDVNQAQSVKKHCENTALLSKEYSIHSMKQIAYLTGLFHDIGKYQKSFQKRIDGEKVQIDHSTCGAIEISKIYNNWVGLMMEYCIAGHHTGIPNGGNKLDSSDMTTLYGRLKRNTEDYFAYKEEIDIPKIDFDEIQSWILSDCKEKEDLIEKFAFVTRYLFSCLTDADSNDTAEFCLHEENCELKSNFSECLIKLNNYLVDIECETELQKARSIIQQQVYEKAKKESEIYLMNMPTGSGKTLCSMKFALERAIKSNKRRIIYIIPYNSIIDQTVEQFEKLFGKSANILRHQSSFSYEDIDIDEDYYNIITKSTENWNAQIIVTTAVQFFESVYANKRGKLRKLHNMSDSILIFDEVHLMPAEFLSPCLRCISYITKYLNSEAVFLSATMPDFSKLIKEYSLSNSVIVDLVEDKSKFNKFCKCNFENLGKISDEELIESTNNLPSKLIIVNKRKTAVKLFNMVSGKVFHLSTYMTPNHRKKVIKKIHEELKCLEIDYPNLKNVPDDRKITVISTSLIEAGVDLDFYCVYRELTNLDSILQAGGRCNREGKRSKATTYIFFRQEQTKSSVQEEITKDIINKFSDISCPEAVSEYYIRFYKFLKDEIKSKAISYQCRSIDTIPFKDYADSFSLIKSSTVSLIVREDEESRKLCKLIELGKPVSFRKLQKYAATVYLYELEDLKKQGVVQNYDSGVWCLTNDDYYDENTGVKFEVSDYYL